MVARGVGVARHKEICGTWQGNGRINWRQTWGVVQFRRSVCAVVLRHAVRVTNCAVSPAIG